MLYNLFEMKVDNKTCRRFLLVLLLLSEINCGNNYKNMLRRITFSTLSRNHKFNDSTKSQTDAYRDNPISKNKPEDKNAQQTGKGCKGIQNIGLAQNTIEVLYYTKDKCKHEISSVSYYCIPIKEQSDLSVVNCEGNDKQKITQFKLGTLIFLFDKNTKDRINKLTCYEEFIYNYKLNVQYIDFENGEVIKNFNYSCIGNQEIAHKISEDISDVLNLKIHIFARIKYLFWLKIYTMYEVVDPNTANDICPNKECMVYISGLDPNDNIDHYCVIDTFYNNGVNMKEYTFIMKNLQRNEKKQPIASVNPVLRRAQSFQHRQVVNPQFTNVGTSNNNQAQILNAYTWSNIKLKIENKDQHVRNNSNQFSQATNSYSTNNNNQATNRLASFEEVEDKEINYRQILVKFIRLYYNKADLENDYENLDYENKQKSKENCEQIQNLEEKDLEELVEEIGKKMFMFLEEKKTGEAGYMSMGRHNENKNSPPPIPPKKNTGNRNGSTKMNIDDLKKSEIAFFNESYESVNKRSENEAITTTMTETNANACNCKECLEVNVNNIAQSHGPYIRTDASKLQNGKNIKVKRTQSLKI